MFDVDPDIKAIVSNGFSYGSILADYTRYGFSGALSKTFRVTVLNETLLTVRQDKAYQQQS